MWVIADGITGSAIQRVGREGRVWLHSTIYMCHLDFLHSILVILSLRKKVKHKKERKKERKKGRKKERKEGRKKERKKGRKEGS